MNIGENIKARRKALKMTQKQLGEKCGIADSAVRKYESGKMKPKLEMLKRIAKALDVNPYELADFDTSTELINDNSEQLRAAYGEEMAEMLEKMASMLTMLTKEGQKKAMERIEELTQIPKYQDQEYLNEFDSHD